MATPQRNEEIARIVKETIRALDSRKSVVGEHAQRQREQIVRALTETRMKKLGIHSKQYEA
jgi:hypothetical protein